MNAGEHYDRERSTGRARSPSLTVTIRHVRAFLAVAKRRSFTRAADDLNISQPSLTMSVRQLEDIVGASLFDRTTRSVLLTPDGDEFLPAAERLIGDFDLAMQDLRAMAHRRRGLLGLASVPSVATRILPHVIKAFSKTNPHVRVKLREGNSSDVRRDVLSNDVELGFASKDTEEPDLEFKLLFRDQLGLLVRKDHPLARARQSLTWHALSEFEFVGLTSDTATAPLLDQIPDLPSSIRLPHYEVSTTSTLWALLENGIGITTTPALSAPEKGSSLRFCPLTQPVVWRSVYVISRRGRSLTGAARKVVSMVRLALHERRKDGLIEVHG